MDIIEKFVKSSHMRKAAGFVKEPAKINGLLKKATSYISKDGIASIKKELVALYDYLRDIVQGKYKEYNSTNLTLAIGAMIYLVTPLDVVPDFIPTGLIDDVAVVTWAINKIRVELDAYLKWKESNKEISSD